MPCQPEKKLWRKLVRLLSILHISPRIRSIMCTIILVQILLYKYCYMQRNVLFSYIKNCVLKIILDAKFEFKSKNNYKREMHNRLKRNFKRKIYINSFCLMSQVLFFCSAGRWTIGKRIKQNKSCLKIWHYRILSMCESKACFIVMWTKRKRMNKLPNIDLTSYRHFSSMCRWYVLFVNDNFVMK